MVSFFTLRIYRENVVFICLWELSVTVALHIVYVQDPNHSFGLCFDDGQHKLHIDWANNDTILSASEIEEVDQIINLQK